MSRGKEDGDESPGSYMAKLRYFGRNHIVSQFVGTLGWDIAEDDEEVDVIIVDTFDNQSAEHLQRLEGTIALMRTALDLVETGNVKSFVALTDQSAENGRTRPNVPAGQEHGTRPNGVHGFGTLTVEVLGRLAAKNGAITRIVKHTGTSDEEVCNAAQHAIKTLNSKELYQVLRLDI
ncbi:MAG: hypothetical protein DWC09_05085 [Candidatus Poseidoniales archaeon]|nr:MAG: hypothetical protein DWC09_05085 [Candidatus Poseidoniales archaeon]